MGKAEENKQLKKTKLLDTAMELFMTKGTAQTSVSDITTAAGVGKGTFYLYFKDKFSIEAQLISRHADAILTHALDSLKELPEKPETFEDKIIAIAEDVLSQLEKNPRYLRFINKNLSWGVFKGAVTKISEDDTYTSASALREMLAQGQEEWNQPDLLLYSIIELVSFTSYGVLLYNEPVPVDEYKKYLREYIRGIISVHKKN